LLVWAQWIEDNNEKRIVRQEEVGPYFVSTVFLGLDHSWRDSEPPHLFETIVFRYDGDERTVVDDAPFNRTSTWEMALEQHAEAMAWVKERLS
jgi:hypothetical protein